MESNLTTPPQTAPHPQPKGGPGSDIPYDLFLDCVHCGLCTAACPTYLELGNENDSPRGRIYLMRSVTDGRLELTESVAEHLNLCLDCRACETACPSGVQYGKLIEPFRVAMEEQSAQKKSADWFHRWILFRLFPYPKRLAAALLPVRVLQKLGLRSLITASRFLLPKQLRMMVEMLPVLSKRSPPLPGFLPAIGSRRARVALFTGCVADAMYRHVHWATARVLQRNGCDVIIPRSQTCCGAIHFHAGQSDAARQLADQNFAAFGKENLDAIIVNVAGCGAMLKDYGHHWHDDRQNEREGLAAKFKDVHEFLDALGIVPPKGRIDLVATYHDACHLGHAQKIREAPRRLLSKIPGLVLKELPETEVCCGAAGTYNLTQPEMAARLAERKVSNIQTTGAEAVLIGNCTCLMHIERQAVAQGNRWKFMQPIELLDESYRLESV